jgi:hypothetical protein
MPGTRNTTVGRAQYGRITVVELTRMKHTILNLALREECGMIADGHAPGHK